jgi:glycerol-3-phosphate dehydrogenase
MYSRNDKISRIKASQPYDVIIIGGGASGLGVALDAVSRKMKVLLLEKFDFGKGTSSKATKLLHGGVRYLAQGDIGLVKEALAERSFVLSNASHLSNVQEFVIPFYKYWQGYYYLSGLKLYDFMSFSKSLGPTKMISKEETIRKIPNIKQEGLKGGIVYFDGQFDDARLCYDLVRTIEREGGICMNYVECTDFIFNQNGKICGIKTFDHIGAESFDLFSKVVVNATGVWSDELMNKAGNSDLEIVPARGSHLVVDQKFLGGKSAVMIPKTTDGRVLFIIPWKNKAIIGTTDVISEKVEYEPVITQEEKEFMLSNAKAYLNTEVKDEDIESTFTGLRPLVNSKSNKKSSKEISRNHKVVISDSGLFSILGGKWTTFRSMGEDTVNAVVKTLNLPFSASNSYNIKIESGPGFKEPAIHPELPYSWNQIEEICNNEMVEKLEDLLARRTRCLILSKKATREVMDEALELLQRVKQKDDIWAKNQRNSFLEYFG